MPEIPNKEKIVGHFMTVSGSVVIADGIHADMLPGAENQRVVIDLGKENTKIPVIATSQSGHKFLLIPVDAAIALPENTNDTVVIEDPVTIPAEESAEPRPQ